MSAARRTLGFSWPALVALAALAAPRVVLHDLGVIEEGSLVNGLFVFVPRPAGSPPCSGSAHPGPS